MPTFLMILLKSDSGATNERRYWPFSIKRRPMVCPAVITTRLICSSLVRSYQRFQVDQKRKPRSCTSRSVWRASISREYCSACWRHQESPVRLWKIHIMPPKNPSHQFVHFSPSCFQIPFSVYTG